MVNFGKGEAMKVQIKITGPRASGKSYMMRHLEREIRATARQVMELNRVDETMIDGQPTELLELEVNM